MIVYSLRFLRKKGLEQLVALGTLLNSNFNTFCLKSTKKCIFFVMVVTMFRMKNKTDCCCVLLFKYVNNKKSQFSLSRYSSNFNLFSVTSQLKILNEKLEASKRSWRKNYLQSTVNIMAVCKVLLMSCLDIQWLSFSFQECFIL